MILSNEIIKVPNSKIEKVLKKFNNLFIYLLVADIIIIFLSMSFGFRMIFAPLYRPTFYLSGIIIIISVILNYYIVVKKLIKKTNSLERNIILIISTLLYPIGIYTINTEKINR
jgi:hypothetical protein